MRRERPFVLRSASRDDVDVDVVADPSRRSSFASVASTVVALSSFSAVSSAEDEPTTTTTTTTGGAPLVSTKTFVDPKGLFLVRVPSNFYTIRRTFKGDLPDAKTGQGRRGSSIFTAGDMTKAEVVAVERFPTAAFLEEEAGVEVRPGDDDLSTFPKLGEPLAVARLLSQRRERQSGGSAAGVTEVLKDAVRVSDDGETLTFQLRTVVSAQKPELLMEQMGVSELVRTTTAKASLAANDGNLMVCYASGLDVNAADDGPVLADVVDSFTVLRPPQGGADDAAKPKTFDLGAVLGLGL